MTAGMLKNAIPSTTIKRNIPTYLQPDPIRGDTTIEQKTLLIMHAAQALKSDPSFAGLAGLAPFADFNEFLAADLRLRGM